MADLKPCCKRSLPYVFDTYLFGRVRIMTTIACVRCGKKASGLTFERAVKKWNRRDGGKENANAE